MPHVHRALLRVYPRWRRHTVRSVTTLVSMLVAAVVLSACSGIGGGAEVEDDPRAALVAAFDDLGSWSGIVVDLRLEADATARAALLEDEELSADAADTLFASSLRVIASGENDDAGVTFALIVDDTELVELRMVEDDRVFVRIDLDTISLLAADAEVEDFDPDELVLAARMFGAGDAAEALVAGNWVELIGIDDLSELTGESTEEGSDEPDPADVDEIPALVEQFAQDMSELVEQDAEVAYVASEDAGERVRVTVATAELASVLERFLEELADVTGNVVGDDDPRLLADELGETVTLDVWLDAGSVTQIGFDPGTAETAEPIEGELLIIAALAEFSGAVEAPTDAVTFDVLQIVGAFFGGLGPGGDPFGGAFDDGPIEDDAPDDETVDGGSERADPDETVDEETPDETPDDETVGDPAIACISDAEIAEIERALGPDGLAEIEELIDAGFIERC